MIVRCPCDGGHAMTVHGRVLPVKVLKVELAPPDDNSDILAEIDLRVGREYFHGLQVLRCTDGTPITRFPPACPRHAKRLRDTELRHYVAVAAHTAYREKCKRLGRKPVEVDV